MWNDPKQEKPFLEKNVYLPILNNLKSHKDSAQFKRNFMRTKKVVFTVSPKEEIIIPWQSCIFGYWDKNHKIINMEDFPFYKNDAFGLQSMKDQGRLHIKIAQDANHEAWLHREDLFKEYVLPYLT